MNDDKIIVDESAMYSIPNFYSGKYSESIICNGTGSDVVVVGYSGSRITIPHDHDNSDGYVTIIVRSTNGPISQMKAPIGREDIKLPSRRYKIHKSLIESGYYYHKETDVVIATPSVGASITHPKSQKNYSSIVEEVTKSLTTDLTTIMFSANDPLARLSELFVCFGGHCFKIACTSINTQELSRFKIFISTPTTVTTHCEAEVEDLFNNGYQSIDAFDKIVVLGRTADEAVNGYRIEKEKNKREIDVIVSRRLSEQRKHDEESKQAEKDTNKLLVQNLKNKIQELEQNNDLLSRKNQTLESEAISRETIIKEYERLGDFKSNSTKHNIQIGLLDEKRLEQRHKITKAAFEVIKVAVPIIVAIVIGVTSKQGKS